MAKKDGSSSLEARVEDIETAMARLDGLVTAELSALRVLMTEALTELHAFTEHQTERSVKRTKQ